MSFLKELFCKHKYYIPEEQKELYIKEGTLNKMGYIKYICKKCGKQKIEQPSEELYKERLKRIIGNIKDATISGGEISAHSIGVYHAREIIDCVLYDTHSAEEICKVKLEEKYPLPFGGYMSLCGYETGYLFKGKNGRYFTCRNSAGIMSMTDQEAKLLLSKQNVEKYIELFGEIEEA